MIITTGQKVTQQSVWQKLGITSDLKSPECSQVGWNAAKFDPRLKFAYFRGRGKVGLEPLFGAQGINRSI
jgi:hypothetical protein